MRCRRQTHRYAISELWCNRVAVFPRYPPGNHTATHLQGNITHPYTKRARGLLPANRYLPPTTCHLPPLAYRRFNLPPTIPRPLPGSHPTHPPVAPVGSHSRRICCRNSSTARFCSSYNDDPATSWPPPSSSSSNAPSASLGSSPRASPSCPLVLGPESPDGPRSLDPGPPWSDGPAEGGYGGPPGPGWEPGGGEGC